MSKQVLYFSAPWCGPCKAISPIVEELQASHSDVEFRKVNIDNESDLAQLHKILAVPTLLALENGSEVGRSVGSRSKDVIVSELKL